MTWRPRSEAEATSNMAALIEWLRATRILPDASPMLVAEFAATEPARFRAAVRDFLALGPDVSAALARADRGSLFAWHNGARCILRASEEPAVSRWSAPDGCDHLIACVAGHLLSAETRAGHRLLWTGATEEPWPIAGLLLGATVILAPGEPADLVAAQATETWAEPQYYPAQAACFRSG